MQSQLYINFMTGLEGLDLNYDEVKYNWRYCGGNFDAHIDYFDLFFKTNKKPDTIIYTKKCVCGHAMEKACYITNGDDLLMLSECCMKTFIPMCGRTCDNCNLRHKNRTVNFCNTCKPKKEKKVKIDKNECLFTDY